LLVVNSPREARLAQPAAIRAAIDERVVGQTTAKNDLATLLDMHLQRFSELSSEHTSPNALLIGPTGVGKTHAIRVAADSLAVPLVIIDTTRLSPAPNQGTTLEDVLVELIAAARGLLRDGRQGLTDALALPELDELQIASRGIVFLDEFDKLSTRGRQSSERSELLQRRLLQFLDGTVVSLNAHPDSISAEVQFDTSGLLFVAAGAFTNLLEDSAKRSQETTREMLQHDHVIFEDLVRFGFMKELIARLPVVIEFDELTAKDLVTIMTTPEVDPGSFYKSYFRSKGTELELAPEARLYIAEKAVRLGIGARGLHQVLFPLLALASQDLEADRRTKFFLRLSDVQELEARVEDRRHVGKAT
jgi:ATP-dependent Clp protease ATP-binding subunit ClpX